MKVTCGVLRVYFQFSRDSDTFASVVSDNNILQA